MNFPMVDTGKVIGTQCARIFWRTRDTAARVRKVYDAIQFRLLVVSAPDKVSNYLDETECAHRDLLAEGVLLGVFRPPPLANANTS
jgi:vancomycin permeability regulator SanA